jgi:hypothetical protein
MYFDVGVGDGAMLRIVNNAMELAEDGGSGSDSAEEGQETD